MEIFSCSVDQPLPSSRCRPPKTPFPAASTRSRYPPRHYVNGNPLVGPFPDGTDTLIIGMGCFWGAERFYWQQPGVYTTAVGYSGGTTPNPTYQETCTGMTGHTEAVLVVFLPGTGESTRRCSRSSGRTTIRLRDMGQGNDIGTQYRSAIYTKSPQQLEAAQQESRSLPAAADRRRLRRTITTEIALAGPFYYAEDYHQQYLAKNPGGYCNHGFCQVGYQPEPTG